MMQPMHETRDKKVYVQPTLEKRERLAEVTEAIMIIPTTGRLPF